MNNLRAECDINNEAKILRIEIVFATLKPAVKSETVECKLHQKSMVMMFERELE